MLLQKSSPSHRIGWDAPTWTSRKPPAPPGTIRTKRHTRFPCLLVVVLLPQHLNAHSLSFGFHVHAPHSGRFMPRCACLNGRSGLVNPASFPLPRTHSPRGQRLGARQFWVLSWVCTNWGAKGKDQVHKAVHAM